MTQEEFYYQCIDVIDYWLNSNRILSDLREVTDKLYNEVTKPHWISMEDELPPCNVFVLTCDGQENENLLMLGGNGRWYDKAVGLHRNITHWCHLPQPPILSNSEKTGKNHLIDANNMVDHFADVSKMVEKGGEK